MNKLLITASFMALSALLSACGTTGAGPSDSVGHGQYFAYVYPGNLPHVARDENNAPATFGVAEFDQLAYLDQDCRAQMASQLPSAIKSVGVTTLRTAIPTAVFGGIGTGMGIKAVTTMTHGYAKYGAESAGGSAFGSGLAGGIDRHLTGNRYAQGQCMTDGVTEAKKRVGALGGIHIIINADAVDGRAIRRPAGPAPTDDARSHPDPTASSSTALPLH